APWEKSVADLSPEQAAWKPSPERHSIWQIVLHINFWRENELRRTETGEKPTAEQIARLNFPEPGAVTPSAWDEARQRLVQTQERIASLLADERVNIERMTYL